MDESGNVVSEWHEPDYVNSSGRNDALYNLVLLPDRETVVALGYKDDGSGDSQYGRLMQKQVRRFGVLATTSQVGVIHLGFPMPMMVD